MSGTAMHSFLILLRFELNTVDPPQKHRTDHSQLNHLITHDRLLQSLLNCAPSLATVKPIITFPTFVTLTKLPI
jgi:hypothetical protein